MKLGVNTYTFMWSIGFEGVNPAYPGRAARPAHPLTLTGLLEQARALGVHLLQTGPNLPLDALNDAELDAFAQTARDWDIALELGTRGLDYEHLAGQIALARRVGATLIRTLPEVSGAHVRSAGDMMPHLRRILPALESAGLCLAIENGRLPADDLRAVLDSIDHPRVGVVLDMVNSLAVSEGWKHVTERLAPRVMCLHYKDFTIRREWHMMGFICEGTPAGQGMVEPAWLFQALQASPYDFNVIVELWTPEQATLEDTVALEQRWAAESVSFLRQYVTA
jgi:sugar phosphate isomerase/epimerase